MWTGVVWTHGDTRNPGQVPRLPGRGGVGDWDPFPMPNTDLADQERWIREPATMLKPESVVKGLGLTPQQETALARAIATEARAAENGLDFRKSLFSWLYTRHPSTLRRVIMERATNFYNNAITPRQSVGDYRNVGVPNKLDSLPGLGLRKGYGGKYTAKKTGEDGRTRYSYKKADAKEGHDEKINQMTKRVKALFDGGPSVKLDKLVPFIREFGQEPVAAALRELGEVRILGEDLFIKSARASMPSPRTRYVGGAPEPPSVGAKMSRSVEEEDEKKKKLEKAAPPQPVGNPNVGDTGGIAQQSDGATGRVGPKGLPTGSKKIWNNRVVTKMSDGKWHVTGHIAGLEGENVPSQRFKAAKEGGIPIDIRSLSKEQAAALISALNQLKKEGESKKETKKDE